jgi:hypothetical protein
MRGVLEREISASIQFFLIMLFALIAAFFWMLPGGGNGEYAVAINLTEAWKDVAPYVNSVLLIFVALSVIRLAAIFLAHSFLKKGAK